MHNYTAFLVASLGSLVVADINWPERNQQCPDDAGPPYLDDEPGVKYHAGSAASPILRNSACPDPIKAACVSRPDAKTAYLEGPIDCGNNGWYCRIFNDEVNGWPNVALNGDLNFLECNKEESFDGGGDSDGHCHGSSDDSTYYWWVRDHWFRQYNGRVRCCCGWYTGGTQPMSQGRIASRCDYRRLVTSNQDLEDCRDANEDHNLGFESGCDEKYRGQIGSPIPEDDSVCWEIERFGHVDAGGGGGSPPPPMSDDDELSPPPSSAPPPSTSGDEDPPSSAPPSKSTKASKISKASKKSKSTSTRGNPFS